jgi:hypothetical protein
MWAVPHHHDHSGAGLSVSVISTPLLSLTSPLTFDAIIMIRWVKIFIPFKQSNSKWHTEITCDDGKFTQFPSLSLAADNFYAGTHWLSVTQLEINVCSVCSSADIKVFRYTTNVDYALHLWLRN